LLHEARIVGDLLVANENGLGNHGGCRISHGWILYIFLRNVFVSIGFGQFDLQGGFVDLDFEHTVVIFLLNVEWVERVDVGEVNDSRGLVLARFEDLPGASYSTC
jgi:hypothetical protein